MTTAVPCTLAVARYVFVFSRGSRGPRSLPQFVVRVREIYKILSLLFMQLLATITFLKYFARRFLAWFFYWIAFFCYFGMLYAFEYSIARYAVYQAVSSTVAAPGKFYNVQPGTSYKIHMHCKGISINVLYVNDLYHQYKWPCLYQSEQLTTLSDKAVRRRTGTVDLP